MAIYVTNYGNDDRNSGDSFNDSYNTLAKAEAESSLGQEIRIRGEFSEVLLLPEMRLKIIGENAIIYAPNNTSIFHNGRLPSEIENVSLIGFKTPYKYSGPVVSQFRLNRVIIKSRNNNTLERAEFLSSNPSYSFFKNCLVEGYDINMGIGDITKSTFIKKELNFVVTPNDPVIVLSECIVFSDEIILSNFSKNFVNCLFANYTTFTYDDGNGNSVNQVDFDTFKTASTTHSWGFDFVGCEVENPIDTFIDYINGIFLLKTTSKAVNMSSDGNPIGGIKVGKTLTATDAGWANNNNFTLVGDAYETTSVADITHIPQDLTGGGNAVIEAIRGEFDNSLQNGRAFSSEGNLGVAVVDGTDLTALGVNLVDGEVYWFEGFTEVRTSLRTIDLPGSEAIVALAGETVNESDGTGSIRPVTDYSGKLKVPFKLWKDGEAEPINFSYAFWNEDLFIDSSGRTNAEVGFDENTKRRMTGRWLITMPTVNIDQIPS